MARSLKNTKAKLDLLTDIDILLMVEKLSEEVKSYHAICQYAKAHNRYIKDYDENKESSYLQYQDVNNLCDWEMSPTFPVSNFEQIEDNSRFNEDFKKNYNEESYEGYFLEVDV